LTLRGSTVTVISEGYRLHSPGWVMLENRFGTGTGGRH
jgi:hypothetical protein